MFTLTTPLTQLEHADLIRRLRELEEAYQFKHNLIQESAYASLLKNDRRALHRACAEALERSYPNELDEHAALLAKHFAEAGDDAKTFEYARRAGDAAFRVHALEEALMHYDTASLLAARLQISVADILHLHQQRGRVLEVMGRYEEAVDAYRALEQLGNTRNEPQLELGALLSLATLFTFPNPAQNLDESLRANQAALQLAREIHDEPSEARALWNMQEHAYFSGRAGDAIRYSKQALEIAERLELRELCAYILNDASRALVTAETVPSALNALAQAREIFRGTNNLPMLVDNLSTTAETAHIGGKIEMSLDFAHQAQELSRTIGNIWNLAYSSAIELTVRAQQGETRQGFELCTQTTRLARQSGFFVAAYISDVVRASMYGELGVPLRGIELLKQVAHKDSFFFMEGWRLGTIAFLYLSHHMLPEARTAIQELEAIVRWDDLSTLGPLFIALCRAELALQEERFADALKETRALLERLRPLEIQDFVPEILLRQGRAHFGLGEWDAAERIWEQAASVARMTQTRFALWEILAASSDLASTRGNLQRAQALKQEAREMIDWLTEHAPEEFRESFLSQEKVREIRD